MRVRTGYSFSTAVGMIADVVARLKEIEFPVAPISDRASTFGYVKFTKAALKAGLRPIYGVELGVTPTRETKGFPIVDYWTFFAKKELKPINELVATATHEDNFRYEPLLTYKQAMAKKGVIKIAGSNARLDEFEPAPDLFISLSPSSNPGYIREALKRGHRLLATSDNRFPAPGGFPLYEVVCSRPKRPVQGQSYPQFLLSRSEWERATAHVCGGNQQADAWENMVRATEACQAKLATAKIIKPERPMTIRAMCEKGAKELGVNLRDPVYRERLERELKLIKEKEFEDYFYIIADVVQWARKEMWVGPARGSSCGSLVCYLTKITTIDPIKFGLIFERFIDINRNDLPDVDIDFSDEERHRVFTYMEEKYGEKHVARLGTVALYKPRSAMSEAAAALDIPRYRTEAVLESLIERSSGDSRALQSLEDTLNGTTAGKEMLSRSPEIVIAAKMEGHPRHSSSHAAGIIITEKPVINYVAIDNRAGVTHCDKKDAEELNFLKIDALGLTQGSIFEDCLKMIGRDHSYLDRIRLDDPAAFEVLNRGNWSGVFQYMGQALQSICKQITVSSLDDIVSITALARPGPLASGGTNHWVARKAGLEPVSYPHPCFEPYLKDTLGIVCYQEQVMEIGRNIGDLSWEDVTALRKAMSKSLGKEFFDQYGDRWKKGAMSRGVPQEVADKIWDELCAYGSWAFNKSHAVAYGHISYQCCWLKAHHPFEFAAATLSHESDPMKMIMMLREMNAEGIGYIPFDLELSAGTKWTAHTINGEKTLVGPLSLVKGIGPAKIAAVEWNRKQGKMFGLSPLKEDKRLAKKVKDMTRAEKEEARMVRLAKSAATTLMGEVTTKVDSLWPIGDRLAEILTPEKREALALQISPTPIEQILKPTDEDRTFVIYALATRIAPRDENEPQLVQRRGYRINDGITDSLLLRMTDDTETIMCKVDRWKYMKLGKPIVDLGRPGKALYAMIGEVRGGSSFRMMMIKGVKYIGDMEMEFKPETRSQSPTTDLSENAGISSPVTEEGARVY